MDVQLRQRADFIQIFFYRRHLSIDCGIGHKRQDDSDDPCKEELPEEKTEEQAAAAEDDRR